MKTDEFTAPSYAELRPYKQPTSNSFPVYHDLVDKLVEAKHQRTIASLPSFGSASDRLGDEGGLRRAGGRRVLLPRKRSPALIER